MAKVHHCPIDGVQPCNAAGSIIHVCPICYTRWEEVIPEDQPVAAAKPATPATPPQAAAPPASA